MPIEHLTRTAEAMIGRQTVSPAANTGFVSSSPERNPGCRD